MSHMDMNSFTLLCFLIFVLLISVRSVQRKVDETASCTVLYSIMTLIIIRAEDVPIPFSRLQYDPDIRAPSRRWYLMPYRHPPSNKLERYNEVWGTMTAHIRTLLCPLFDFLKFYFIIYKSMLNGPAVYGRSHIVLWVCQWYFSEPIALLSYMSFAPLAPLWVVRKEWAVAFLALHFIQFQQRQHCGFLFSRSWISLRGQDALNGRTI